MLDEPGDGEKEVPHVPAAMTPCSGIAVSVRTPLLVAFRYELQLGLIYGLS
ncbi:MAG: hypothetical protein OEU26_01000 [Candidatus Tectomicrobia bacterium]|nr:hypothetical protein [Candidatus Tectomicrobia bacterium]